MYRRMLFVGLGGSGGKTLRVLKRDLKEWLNDQGWKGEFPAGWQFVHIDTPAVADGKRPGGGDLDESEYLGLIGTGVGFQAVADRIDNIPGIGRELAGWRVDPQALGVPLAMGAGQFRAIGRAIGMCYAQPIKERLQLAIGKLNNPNSAAVLGNLYSHVNDKAAVVASASPIAIVVSSLAGGTGAGLLVDVCDTLRSLEPTWGSESIALLYTPEVFLGLGDGSVGGVQPNSLAAVSEVLNGYWWHGGTANSQVPKKSPSALKAAGMAKDIAQSGPFCPYLIGSTSSGGVQFSSDTQLFETVGAALVSWATDLKVQQNFIAHTIGNWQAAAKKNQPNLDILVNYGANAIEPGTPAFSALGFSRVSLGVKYLQRYAAKRLAKDGALHLANAHLASPEAQSIIQSRKIVDPVQITDELAERYVSWFMNSANLDEKGPEKNQIIEKITPSQWWSIFDINVARATQLSAQSGSSSASDWIQFIIPAVEEATKSFGSAIVPLAQENINGWLKTQPDHVLSVVEESISRWGLKVAAAILMKAAHTLSNPADGVVAELLSDSEMNKYLRFANPIEWQKQLRVRLDESSKSKIASDHPAIHESIVEAMKYSTCISRAMICERTADLVADFASGFLKPLSRDLADAAGVLDSELSKISEWPNWGDGLPPQDLRPPKSEWTLIEPEEFSQVFIEKLAQSFSEMDRLATDDHQHAARTQVVSGAFIRDLMLTSPGVAENLREHLLLQQLQKWSPDYRVSQKPEPKKDAVFQVRTKPEQIMLRANEWMMQKGTPFQLLLSSTLRTYTAPEAHHPNTATPTEYKQRQKRFLEKLSAAISAAEPLVGIDQGMIGLIHPNMTSGGSMKIKRDVSQIPFLAHPIQDDIKALLEQTCYAGPRANEIDDVLVPSARLPHIDVVSQLDSPVSPLVIKSLMQPISNAWTQAKSSGVAVGGFWSNRRARTLREFVPIPQEHLRAMIRGWFTGKLLGLIRLDDNKKISIILDASDRSPRWVAFPERLLSTSNQVRDQLPLILEALPLAYAAVGTASSLSPLDPYIALRNLGTSSLGARSELYSYEICNPVLAAWLKSGEVPNEKLIPGFKGARPDIVDADPGLRKAKVVKFLGDQISEYNKSYDEYLHKIESNMSLLGRAPFWPEIKEEIEFALDQLLKAIDVGEQVGDF